nr:hypothetical protein BaRGS_001741 [Batillaria attramentaria]
MQDDMKALLLRKKAPAKTLQQEKWNSFIVLRAFTDSDAQNLAIFVTALVHLHVVRVWEKFLEQNLSHTRLMIFDTPD